MPRTLEDLTRDHILVIHSSQLIILLLVHHTPYELKNYHIHGDAKSEVENGLGTSNGSKVQ